MTVPPTDQADDLCRFFTSATCQLMRSSGHARPSRRRRCNFFSMRSYGATLQVNMRDIETWKEDDGFECAFLSP